MRQNPSFAMTDVGELRRIVEQNPWATLVSSTDDGLVASHYAVLLDDTRDDLTVVGHVGKP
ncbi:MAG TPA: transcriptional regulator, partial [Microbacterium sp.]|nr:transcriptional regulator [Microbacterium sp.]